MILVLAALPAAAATFGTVVSIGGQASDLALDETRGVVYVANFTANRIDVISTSTAKVQQSIYVGRQPASLALSPDGRWLVVTHVSNFGAPLTPYNGLTVIDLSGSGNIRQTYTFGAPPLGVAFGNDGIALVVTTKEFLSFDPRNGYTRLLDTVQNVTTKALPVPIDGGSPREILRASVTASGDGSCVYGVAEVGDDATQRLNFEYRTAQKTVRGWLGTSEPQMGPRVVSTDRTGSLFLTGWALYDRSPILLAQFPSVSGEFQIGSHAIDGSRGIVYAQMSPAKKVEVPPDPVCGTLGGVPVCVQPPGTITKLVPTGERVLLIADADNLNVREKLKLAENLSGRAVLTSRGDVMYAVSDSGLTILPVGSLSQQHRVVASAEDIVIRGQWCDRKPLVQEFTISDPGGGQTDFRISSDSPDAAAVAFSVLSGVTPAKVRVTVDMTRFQNRQGTTDVKLNVTSNLAVNVIPPVRLLINNREPDQRGTFFNVPGKLVDIQADPVRNRFYILRQDKNEVLVFDAATYRQTATLRTGNTPWSMAITPDRQYLIVGADNSQVAYAYDLDTLRPRMIRFPAGHYPRSISASNGAILAASRVAGPKHTIDKIDLLNGYAVELPSLGVWENNIDVDTALAATPSGTCIMGAMADGRTLLYNATEDTFVAARKSFETLKGAFAALADDMYVVDTHVLNGSLVPVGDLPSASGSTSGIAIVDGLGLRTAAPSTASPGFIDRLKMNEPATTKAVRLTEAPLLPPDETHEGETESSVFTRTLAPLANRNAIVSLSVSGFTVLPWTYDAAIADPRIEMVRNAADNTASVAPGGLISIYGRDLSPVNAASSESPLPTLLGDSCLTVNGTLVPMIFVSPAQINAQLPFNASGSVTMVLHTPTGVSNAMRFDVAAAAPAVFKSIEDGWSDPLPTVYRAANGQRVTLSNPVHYDDHLSIYLTGMGLVTPEVASGAPAPTDPLAQADISPEVTLGGTPLWVEYAGLAPGSVGVYQINVKVPFKDVPTGMEIPLTISQGGAQTTVNVRVVR